MIGYFAFDLMFLDGYDLKRAPLEHRKELLAPLVDPAEVAPRLRYSQSITGNGPDVFRQACRLGVVGIVPKRRDSQYAFGWSRSWLKTKCPRLKA